MIIRILTKEYQQTLVAQEIRSIREYGQILAHEPTHAYCNIDVEDMEGTKLCFTSFRSNFTCKKRRVDGNIAFDLEVYDSRTKLIGYTAKPCNYTEKLKNTKISQALRKGAKVDVAYSNGMYCTTVNGVVG